MNKSAPLPAKAIEVIAAAHAAGWKVGAEVRFTPRQTIVTVNEDPMSPNRTITGIWGPDGVWGYGELTRPDRAAVRIMRNAGEIIRIVKGLAD